MKYYLAEYSFSANLAEFEGEKKGKSYLAKAGTIRELMGMVWIPRSGRIIVTEDRFVTTSHTDAVEWLMNKVANKIRKLQEEIRRDHEPELKMLRAFLAKCLTSGIAT